jgi:hypothetical protein
MLSKNMADFSIDFLITECYNIVKIDVKGDFFRVFQSEL